MPTDRNASHTSEPERPPSDEATPTGTRTVTDADREDLIEDARAFRKSHTKTFQLLSETVR